MRGRASGQDVRRARLKDGPGMRIGRAGRPDELGDSMGRAKEKKRGRCGLREKKGKETGP